MRRPRVTRAGGIAAVLCGLVWLPQRTHAALQWEEKTVELRAAVADRQAAGEFRFKNTGNYPVKIVTVSASCSCTAAVVDKKLVLPGESGRIAATLTLGRREGMSQKTVMVITDDPAEKIVSLSLDVFVPPVLTLEPRYLNWAADEAFTPKTIRISVGSNYPVHGLKVTSLNANVEAKLEGPPGPKVYLLSIVPRKTDAVIVALVRVQADFPPDYPRAYYVTVHVN